MDFQAANEAGGSPAGAARARSLSAEFDEHLFPPRADAARTYAQSVAAGYQRMRQSRVVIAGLARDNGAILPLTVARIERLGQLFRDYRVVIYENDSVDNTREILHTWQAQNSRVQAVCEDRTDPVNQPTRCLSRAARMAFYRGRCQETIRAKHADADYVILVDTDLVGGWSYDGVAHTFGQEGWDFVGAYGIIYRRSGWRPNDVVHYDAWAFRLDAEFTPLSTKVVNRMLYQRGQGLVPVASCFGGLGVYRTDVYLTGQYDGSDVEHVSFHRDLYLKGLRRIFLNPNLIALYGRKHRTWDRRMAWMMRAIERVTGRPHLDWQFSADQPTPIAAQRNTPPQQRAA